MPDFGIGEALSALLPAAVEAAPEVAAIGETAAMGAEGGLDALIGGVGGGGGNAAIDSAFGALGQGAETGGLGSNVSAFSMGGSAGPGMGFDVSPALGGATDPLGGAVGGGAGGGGSGAFDLGSLTGETAKTGETALAGGTDLASLTGGAKPVGGAAGAAGGEGGGNIFEKLIGGVGDQVMKNPIGLAAGVGGLGYNLLKGQQPTPNVSALQGQAGKLAGEGANLESYIQTGQLPPGLQANIDQATKAAKAHVISNYAAQGQSTDPAHNSALAQELSAIDMAAVGQAGKMATDLLQAGMKETDMSNQLYQYLVSLDQKQAENQGKAIANFAAALAPKNTFTLNTGSAA